MHRKRSARSGPGTLLPKKAVDTYISWDKMQAVAEDGDDWCHRNTQRV